MSGCQTCGGFGMHHDPVAHGWQAADEQEWHPCPDCGCMCSASEWACWRCGAVQDGEL